MFDNIGGKIKKLALVITWIGIIASVIGGIVLMQGGPLNALIGLAVIIVGSLISWVSSFITYGFGQLVENSDKLAGVNGVEQTTVGELSNNNEKLETLKKWKEEGLITEAEYEAKVRALR